MKAAEAAMMSEQEKYGERRPPITITVTKKTDSARNFIGAINTPFGTVLTILSSIAFGVGLNLLLSQSAPPSALVLASKPAAPASMAPGSAPPPPTTTAAVPASAAFLSASPPPTTTAAAPDHGEIAGLLALGRAYLADGDVALARVLLRRAAERDEPEAALALGGTYDPAELRRLGIPNFQAQADPSKAREWYRRAADLGAAGAVLLLERLP
jgi:TPR repeat protein